jgi:hypothetical protein
VLQKASVLAGRKCRSSAATASKRWGGVISINCWSFRDFDRFVTPIFSGEKTTFTNCFLSRLLGLFQFLTEPEGLCFSWL